MLADADLAVQAAVMVRDHLLRVASLLHDVPHALERRVLAGLVHRTAGAAVGAALQVLTCASNRLGSSQHCPCC